MNAKQRKKIRLAPELYKVIGLPCSITLATKGAQKIFLNECLAESFVTLIRDYCLRNDIPLYTYCVMPDHVHLLISASDKKDIIEFVRELKSLSTIIAWQHGYTGTIWQKSFYDHFLRKDEDCQVVANYIVQNPVRQHIVEHWGDYRFSGSLVYDLE